ncbi:hypothetical protein GN956_G14270 [Arapaima gigas]
MDEYIKRQFKENSDSYRDALERIVQKYSRVDGSGMEVCLRSMTCHSARGTGHTDSSKHVTFGISASRLFPPLLLMQDVSQLCDDTSVSMETSVEKSTNASNLQWESGVDSSCLLSSTMSDSHCSQPEDEDEELEQTLRSQGSTLLDLYPSMLSQVGEAWRRQRVVEAGSTILRRYRRRIWFPNTQKSSLNSSIRGQGVKNRRKRGVAYVMDTRGPTHSVLSSPEETPQTAAPVCRVDRKSSSSPLPAHVAMVTTPSPPRAGHSSPFLGSGRDRWASKGVFTRLQQGVQASCPELKRYTVPGSPARCSQHGQQGSITSIQHFRDPEDHRQQTPAALKPCTRGSWSPPRRPGTDLFQAGRLPLKRRSSFSGFQVSQRAASKQIDLEFQKIYHRFVCQARTSFLPRASAHTCCSPVSSLRKREALWPSSSSSSLAALALSPAWTRMRKRQREATCDLSPLSKRFCEWGVAHNVSPSRHVGVPSHVSFTSTLGRSPGAPTSRSPQCLKCRLLSPAPRGEREVLSEVTGNAARRRRGSHIADWLRDVSSRRRLQYKF